MGLAERDYMRDRYRRHVADGYERALMAQKNRGFVTRSRGGSAVAQKLVIGLCALTFVFPFVRDARLWGWLPDRGPEVEFPATGSVTAKTGLRPASPPSFLSVTASHDRHALVQLIDGKGRHAFTVYVRKNDAVHIPAPSGRWIVRLIEGPRWFGESRLFGANTSRATVERLVEFGSGKRWGIDLNRRIDGNIPIRDDFGSEVFQ